MDGRRRTLLDGALALRVPSPGELNKPLGSVKLDSLRVIDDAKRTDALISAGIATRFQRRTHVPRNDGRKLPTIIQIHPEGDSKTRTYRAPQQMRPSVEDVRALVERIAQVERDVALTKTSELSQRIADMKRRLVDLEGDEETSAIAELQSLSDQRSSIAGSIRREAFARIDADAEFAPRRWLSLFAIDGGNET